jgi:hypothetical protein
MRRIVWLLALFLIANFVFNWRVNQWKANQIKQASDKIDKRIDETMRTLDAIKQRIGNDEAWQRLKHPLEKSLEQSSDRQ